jgi:crotonobetainyl-CoA:carnitine CoA-transferase CaiB-like acyl-CoA transferase
MMNVLTGRAPAVTRSVEEHMTGIFDGLRVLDLTRGIAGPMTAMFLADHGGDVVRVEPPDGDPCGDVPGYAVWNRGKRLARLDLTDVAARAELLDLVARADVLVESYRPGVTTRLGIDHQTLAGVNPSLVYASITGYGRDNGHSSRPGIDWLVSARTGMQWDQRGYYGTRMEHIMGTDADASTFPVPPGAEQTGCREGPIFLAVPWPSIGAALLAITGISSALYVRERTGVGQLFETSLLQAVLMENAMGWQRVAAMHPSYRLWYFDRRAPKGLFRASDGMWLHQWAPFEHQFIRHCAALAAVGSDELPTVTGRPAVEGADDYERQVELEAHEFVETAAAIAMLPRNEWIRRFATAGRAAQPVRSPEEGLMDAALEREGVIVEVDDPVHGRIRMAGHTYTLGRVPSPPIRPRSLTPEEPRTVASGWAHRDVAPPTVEVPPAPLAGVLVLDFGLAIAGPYGPQILADHGATVIKVTSREFSLTDAIYVGSSRGKLAIALDLKDPRGRAVAHRLIERADVVHHNMRTGVAERLGIGYADAQRLNQRIVYCHTRGFEQDGPRTALPGNDQMGNALAGTEYEAGGTHHGTPPIWHTIAFGDTGNGVLSANAVIQALLHRERTGEGQFVHTSILNTCMLFNTYTFATPDGAGPCRERIDARQYGFSATRRLYETADGWLAVHVRHDVDWRNLCAAIGADHLLRDPRFADADARRTDDQALATELGRVLSTAPAERWFRVLDANGVPCEVSSSAFARALLEDADARRRGWVVANDHPHLGTVTQTAMSFSFSATSQQNLARSPVTGEHSRAILADLGYSVEDIDDLVADGVVVDGACTEERSAR